MNTRPAHPRKRSRLRNGATFGERLATVLHVDAGYETACWRLPLALGSHGYATVRADGRIWRAHRYFYEQLVGVIPDGLHLDHRCRNPACVNPDHLRAVTPRVNAIENNLSPTAINAAKAHCIHGHPFSGSNLILDSEGRRRCRTCKRSRQLARYHEHKVLKGATA